MPANALNTHLSAIPGNVQASLALLADGLLHMMPPASTTPQTTQGPTATQEELLESMLHTLRTLASNPPDKLQGAPDSWFDNLERVPKEMLQRRKEVRARGGENKLADANTACPICGFEFLDDEYPLVVRLPCHPEHLFDLECIRPWLKVNTTCPIDRTKVVESKGEKESRILESVRNREKNGTKVVEDEDDEDDDDDDDPNGFFG